FVRIPKYFEITNFIWFTNLRFLLFSYFVLQTFSICASCNFSKLLALCSIFCSFGLFISGFILTVSLTQVIWLFLSFLQRHLANEAKRRLKNRTRQIAGDGMMDEILAGLISEPLQAEVHPRRARAPDEN
ncbi:hypothetical protein EG68_09655, partial [Paragonimus skrjabini miyazakii]